jgi:thioredoxin 1
MAGVVNVTEAEFDDAVATGVVIVDFWAAWCGPCRAVAPLLERLAAEQSVTVVKVDVDAEPALAGRFDVMSIPTLVVFQDGTVAARQVGAVSYDRLVELAARNPE